MLTFAIKISAAMHVFNSIVTAIGIITKKIHGRSGEYYNWTQGKIFYKVSGHGTPVVVVHGFRPDDSGAKMMTTADSLALEHTVYNIDLLGFGQSEKPWITYTNYIYVLLLRDFIKNIIGEKADVVACEGSCLSVLQAKSIYPDLIGKVTLIDPCRKESIICPKHSALRIKSFIDLPICGTFLYNLYSIASGAPLDSDARHVFVSRLTGHLSTDISNYKKLITSDVIIKEEKKIPTLSKDDLYSSEA